LTIIIKMANVYKTYNMKDKNGNIVPVDYHLALVGVVEAAQIRLKENWDAFIIVTGSVGDGKSNLVAGITALFEHMNGREMDYDNVVWTSKAFVEKTDRGDNFGKAIWWDEAIQGSSGKKMALTSEGDALKMALVTKRFKKHFYILIVDEIEEYAWKLIKKASAWIHVKTIGLQRGYFDVYTKSSKIKTIYRAFKEYKWDWSRITLSSDLRGKFNKYMDVFFEQEEYDTKKLEATQIAQEEKDKKKKELSDTEFKNLALNFRRKGFTNVNASTMLGISVDAYDSRIKRLKLKVEGFANEWEAAKK